MSILQQRLGLPEDTPLEFVNGGHGIKNPLAPSTDTTRQDVNEKLPPPGTTAARLSDKHSEAFFFLIYELITVGRFELSSHNLTSIFFSYFY